MSDVHRSSRAVSGPDDLPRRQRAAIRALVRTGWDRASRIYRRDDADADHFRHSDREYRRWLRPIFERVPRGRAIVDLGCGAGWPTASLLAERYSVLGVDLSPVQVRRARGRVPRARFRCADMTRVRFAAGSLGAVVCLYALIHVPLSEQRPLLARIRKWLAPGGVLLVVTGRSAWTGTERDWLGSGAPMYWSHADAATYARWFDELGYRLLHRETIPESGAAHELFLLRTPRSSPAR